MEFNQVDKYAALAGTALSLILAFFPKVKDWFDKLEPDYKQLIQLGTLAVVVFGTYGLGFLGQTDAFSTDLQGLFDAVVAYVLAIVANAGTYKATNYLGKVTRKTDEEPLGAG